MKSDGSRSYNSEHIFDVILGVFKSLTLGALLDANRDITRGRLVLWKLDLTASRGEEEITLRCMLLRRVIVKRLEGDD